MSYISAAEKGNKVIVWERNNPRKRTQVEYKAKYYCYVLDPKGKYTSIYNDRLSKKSFNTKSELTEFKRANSNSKLFESDIPADLRILSKHYYNVPAPKLNITFLDIEVDYDKLIGFSTIDDPYAPINAIALYHNWSNRVVILAVPPPVESYLGDPNDLKPENIKKLMNVVSPLPTDTQNEIMLFDNERMLLKSFLNEIGNSDILSGWNSDWFDMPYIGMRLLMLDGVDITDVQSPQYQKSVAKHAKLFNRLSFGAARRPSWREAPRFGTTALCLDLNGRMSVDYLDLFKKYEMAERPSYKLEAIADEVLPNLPKLEYEGSLASLYTTNFPWFCRYNFRDTEILKGFEDKLGYVELANQMVHLSTGSFKHVNGTLKLAELATINFCHHELDNLIVNDVDKNAESSSIKGAFVLIPQVGLHKGIGSVDINSLYPSAIRSINISPETLIGQFTGQVNDAQELAKGSNANIIMLTDSGDVIQMTAKQWRVVLKAEKWAVSGFGTIFDQSTKGIIPAILESWYATRKQYQKQMIDAKNDQRGEEAAYYDRLQYVYKIKLNSFYGALTNAYFRFYDLRMGESTTGTGRAILLHQCAQTVKELTGEYVLPNMVCIKPTKGPNKGKYIPASQEQINDPDESIHYGYSDKYPIIYGDTDSTYFSTGYTSNDKSITKADEIGELVNKSFPNYMRNTFMCNDGFDNIIKTGREIVSDRGLFVDKKRYMLHIINDDGFDVDKCKVMGLDTKKTTLPKEVANTLNDFVERYLKGDNWDDIALDIVDYKDKLASVTTDNFMGVGLPKGVKKVKEYTDNYNIDPTCFLPGHVSASINFNIHLMDKNDKETQPIHTGDKIKVFYLTTGNGRFKAIAIPVDIEQIPQWIKDSIVPNIDIPAHIERLVDKPLNNIIKSVGLLSPSKQSLLTDSLIEF